MAQRVRQVVVIGGGSAYDSYEAYLKNLKRVKLDFGRLMKRGWKDSFAQRLGPKFQVVQPKMPTPDNAKYTEWAIWFRKIIPFLKDGVVLVGHSLGGLFLAKYLSMHRFPKRIKATILIATPFTAEGLHESLGDFTLPSSLKRFKRQGGRIIIYHSPDDPVVPLWHAGEYWGALHPVVFRVCSGLGHFNQPTFPELVREIRAL